LPQKDSQRFQNRRIVNPEVGHLDAAFKLGLKLKVIWKSAESMRPKNRHIS